MSKEPYVCQGTIEHTLMSRLIPEEDARLTEGFLIAKDPYGLDATEIVSAP